MTDAEFLERLRELCLRYDIAHGGYPEHEYEGWALYEFAATGATKEVWEDQRVQAWHKEMRRLETAGAPRERDLTWST